MSSEEHTDPEEPARTVLLVSNRRPDESGGRAEKVDTRMRALEEYGWEVVVGYVSEPYVSTFPSSLLRCLRVARSADVDVVNSINNPFHIHVIGFLVSRLLGKPWLAELRDPISTHPDRGPGTVVTRLATAVERLVVRCADRVVWLDGIQLSDDYFERNYPDVDATKFTKLPFMGYESERFEVADPLEFDSFAVTYAGSFYEGWIEPYSFIEGVGMYVERTGDRDLEIHFYGDWSPAYERAVREADIEELVEAHGFVPHEEVVPALLGSDALLYVGGTDPRNELNVPSKIWDYVGARAPILAVVDPSFRVAEFIERHGLGIVVPPDPGEIADAMSALRDGTAGYDPDGVASERFTRERQLRELAGTLSGLVGDRPSDGS